MNPRTKIMVSFGVIIFLIMGLYFFSDWFSKTTGYVLGQGEKIRFAGCLNEKNSVLYIEDNCLECDEQREIIGDDVINHFNVVICEDQCTGLQSTPAWEIEGNFYYGVKNFKQLSDISGCEIETGQ